MIRQVRGIIEEKDALSVVVSVGAGGGSIGYLVSVPNTSVITVGEEVVLHTHLAVRETAMDLYGFLTRDELEMFELLLGVPKIGPKSALQILSQADVALLKTAALSDDASHLTKMSGIGKKTAEKIVVELRNKLDDEAPELVGAGGGVDGDVIDALVTLGYSQKEAREAIVKIDPEHTDANARIREALKLLSKG